MCTTKYHHFTVSGTKIYSAYTLLAIKKTGANPLCSVWQTSQECIFPCYLSFPCCIYSKSAESIFLVETVPIVSPSASMHLGIPQGFSITWYGYQWETPIWDNPKSVSDDPSTSRSRYSVTQTNFVYNRIYNECNYVYITIYIYIINVKCTVIEQTLHVFVPVRHFCH